MAGEKDVAEKVHTELGASTAARWMACPGSIQLIRTVPTPPSTEYAEEGTAAHALGELALRKGVDPDMWVGLELEGVAVDDDMADYVRVYVDYCREYMTRFVFGDKDPQWWIEQRVNLGALNPPGPMFGTADFVSYYPSEKTLTVVDLKYGVGVVVEAKGNKQLRYYALGALLALPPGTEVKWVRMAIVQPRAEHPDGVIRTETISLDELLGFASDLLEAARKTQEPNAPLVAGRHCKFCPAAGICPAQYAAAQETAMVEFQEMPVALPPAPETLDDATFVEFLGKLHILEDWTAAMWGHLKARLERGEEVPGWKLVNTRPTRQWTDAAGVRQWLEAQGYVDEEIEARKLKSPAQIEKLLKKAKRKLPEEYVKKVSSGYSVAAETDKRQAVNLSAGGEFPALPPGTEE